MPGETAARWVRGDEMNEACRSSTNGGRCSRLGASPPQTPALPLRRHLYNNLNQSIAFATAAPEKNRVGGPY